MSTTLCKFGYEVYFYANQEQIALEECENLDKPVLACNGQCYLMKQLEIIEVSSYESNTESKDKKESKTNTLPVKDYLQEVDQFYCYKAIWEEKEVSFDFYKNSKSSDFIHSIFHPPCIA